MTYTKELYDRVRQNLRMFDYPRFDDGDIDDLLNEIDRLEETNKTLEERIDKLKTQLQDVQKILNTISEE